MALSHCNCSLAVRAANSRIATTPKINGNGAATVSSSPTHSVLASSLNRFNHCASSSSTFHSHTPTNSISISIPIPIPFTALNSSSASSSASSSSLWSASSSSPSASVPVCSPSWSCLVGGSFPLSVSVRRGARVLTRVQLDQKNEKKAAEQRAAEKEKVIERAHLNAKILPDSNLSTRDILTKNLLHVPRIDASYKEVFGDFRPTLSKPAPWVRTEEELKKIQPIALPWKEKSVRTGVIGRKMGMMHVWDHWGRLWPLTCIKIDSVVVRVDPNINAKSGLVSMQLGSGIRPTKKTNKPMLGEFKKAGIAPRRQIREFHVSPDAVLPVGYLLTARHFVPGQYVDVRGVSIGKGFQGGMKRWNFHGMPASHGVSIVHRHIGSVGNMGAARIQKGKKMPGRLGGTNVTCLNKIVYKIDVVRNLIYVVGGVPGYDTNFVTIRDAIKKTFHPSNPPPFPTYVPTPGEPQVKEIVMPAPLQDPDADD